MRPQTSSAIAGCSEEEGDEICRMVLQLVRAIVRDPSVYPAARRESVPVSPVYREYQRLVETTPEAA